MNYRKLGNTDLKVSTICLGTMTWGEQNSQDEAFQQMDFALDYGVNFWDTAELYAVPPKAETFGYTEEIIGNWFEKTKKREKVILATKVSGPGRNWIRNGEKSFFGKNLKKALDESLRRLKTDYIEDTLVELKNCLESEKMPNSGDDCDNCRWYNEKKNKGL